MWCVLFIYKSLRQQYRLLHKNAFMTNSYRRQWQDAGKVSCIASDLCAILTKFVIYRQIFIRVSNINFAEVCLVGAALIHADRRTWRGAPCHYASERASLRTLRSMQSVTALRIRQAGLWQLTAQRYWLASGWVDRRVWQTGFTFSSKLRGRNAEHVVLGLSSRELLFSEKKTG